jgi:hypothetical protein
VQSRRSPDSTDHRIVFGAIATAETQPLNPAQRAATQSHDHLIPQTTDSSSKLSWKVNQEIKALLIAQYSRLRCTCLFQPPSAGCRTSKEAYLESRRRSLVGVSHTKPPEGGLGTESVNPSFQVGLLVGPHHRRGALPHLKRGHPLPHLRGRPQDRQAHTDAP